MGEAGQINLPIGPYNDSVLTITNSNCPDPYMLYDKGMYYLTFTNGGSIELWAADSPFDFENHCKKETIFRPPPDQPYSADVWAPELHAINGQWFVYFAANDAKTGNRNHRMYVLAGPPADASPMEPDKWSFHGRMGGMPDDQWAIDGTVVTLQGKMYFVYSGWPLETHFDESRQEIFIVEMTSPTDLTGRPVAISEPDMQFEFSGKTGVNEGPQFLCSPDGRWSGIVYSCAGSWTSDYKMNMLNYTGGSPTDPSSWKKSNKPLLQSKQVDTPPYGPGHGNFVLVNLPNGPEVWGVFHATDAHTGWDGRKARLMRVGWSDAGPFMGNGECGNCCSVDEFVQGCQGGQAFGGCNVQFLDQGQGRNYTGEKPKDKAQHIFKEGKGLVSNMFK